MRSAIDARGSTIAATVALLAGIALIAGSLLRVGHRAPSVDVVSWTVPAPVKTHDVEQTVAPNVVVRESHARPRAATVPFPRASSGLPASVGLTAVDDLALPAPVPMSTSMPLPSQPETSDGLATAATNFGEGLARGSQKAGARTAGFFKRFGRKVASSFAR